MFLQRPGDIETYIIPSNATLELGRVVVGSLVDQIGDFRENEITMCNAGRGPDLTTILFGEFSRNPATQSRRIHSDIHDHVKNSASHYSDKLSLRLLNLIVEAPQHTLSALTMIVLDE
ncbi:hypothetical protein LMG19087_00591 [Ralstonia wenshanensis]|nr:hypothetical protein LMG19087_00591 [Ralstonia wenshanensis]